MTDSKRPMQGGDLFAFRWLQSGQLSPDGTQVAYTVTHIDGEKGEEKEHSTLYVQNIATGKTRQMTPLKGKDMSPTWSPDGSTIAFVSDRDEKPQIYLLPVDGGEALPLTEMKQGAGSPVWSPDGTQIAFTASIDYGEDKAPDRSKEPYRVTRNVWRFDAIGDIELAVNNLYNVDVETKEVTQLTDDATTIKNGVKWSPDGTRLFYSAMMQPDKWAGFESVHYVIDTEGEAIHTLDNLGYLGSGTWLDDERLIFVGNYDTEVTIGTHPNLQVYTLADGALDNRTTGMELGLLGGLEGRAPTMGQWAFQVAVSDDKQVVYLQVQVGGEVGIYRIALTGDLSAERIIAGERACYLCDMVGETLLFAGATINDPMDLYVASVDGSDEKQLTHLNRDLMAQFVMPAYENLHFTGTDGVEVEGWFVKPTNGASAPYPTILWIHGGPHGAQGNTFAFDTHMLAGAGYGVLFINHRASTGYGDAFSTAIKGDWGNLDYGDLMAGVDYAIEKGLADPDKLGCCGISGGGNLSTWIVGQTDRFKAAVPQNPVTNWQSFYGVSDIGVWFATRELGGHPHEMPDVYDKCSPITFAHKCTTPTLMIQTEHDWRCPAEQSEQFYTVLRANGCTVEMLRQPQGSHGGSIRGPLPLRTANLKAKLDWFNQYILGIEPTDKEEEAEADKAPAVAD
ncbi:MAG: S9 family peptidase [Chloroflexota bacterium]